MFTYYFNIIKPSYDAPTQIVDKIKSHPIKALVISTVISTIALEYLLPRQPCLSKLEPLIDVFPPPRPGKSDFSFDIINALLSSAGYQALKHYIERNVFERWNFQAYL